MPLSERPNIGHLKQDRDVDGLARALEDADPDVRQAAAEALEKIGDALALEPVIAALRDWDWDWDVRWAASQALAKFGEPAAEPLIAALKDKDGRVRYLAVEALGRIGDRRAVEPLIAALKDKDRHVRRAAAGALLAKIGDARAVEPLIAALGDRDVDVRQSAAEALGWIGDARAVEPLIAALKDKDVRVRWAAAEALGRIGDARAVEPLIAALRHPESEVRQTALDALEKVGYVPGDDQDGAAYWIARREWDRCVAIGAAAVGPLSVALKDPDLSQAAAHTLAKIGTPAVDALIGALSRGFYVAYCAANALAAIGDERAVRPLLIYAQRTGDVEVGPCDVHSFDLFKTMGTRALIPLVAVLAGSPDLRWAVGEAVKAITGSPDIREVLIAALNHEKPDVRTAAAFVLGKEGGRSAVDALVGALSDEHCGVRCAVAEALGRGIAGVRGIGLLTAMLSDDDWQVRHSAVEALESIALKRIGGPRAVEALAAALNHDDWRVRGAAADALERIGGPEAERPLAEYRARKK